MNKLQREEDLDGWRWYTDGENKYISVTKVLDVPVAETLKKYMKNNSANKQEKTLKEAGDFGTAFHKIVEKDLLGEDVEVPEKMEKHFNAWKDLKLNHAISSVHNEKMLCSKKFGVGGTVDIVGLFEGNMAIMDIKTGFYSVKAGWQMAIYREMCIEAGLVDKNCGMVGISIPKKGGDPMIFKYEHFDWCLKSFVACLECFKGLYFTKLNKMEWKYLHQNSMEVVCRKSL